MHFFFLLVSRLFLFKNGRRSRPLLAPARAQVDALVRQPEVRRSGLGQDVRRGVGPDAAIGLQLRHRRGLLEVRSLFRLFLSGFRLFFDALLKRFRRALAPRARGIARKARAEARRGAMKRNNVNDVEWGK